MRSRFRKIKRKKKRGKRGSTEGKKERERKEGAEILQKRNIISPQLQYKKKGFSFLN